MPKKPNFLGGMQNYDKNTGEYEPSLVGKNGKVVKDADGDGVSHESKPHSKSSQEKQKFIEKINNLEWGDIVYGYDKDGNLININEYDEEKDKFLGYDGNSKPVELSYEETANLQRLGTKLGKNKQEQDFNDPSKRESAKFKEKDFNSKYDQIFDDDYQRSWGIPKFEDENDIKTLNDIVEKAMEYDGEEGAIDISNNAIERIEELVKFTPEEQDKLSTGTGEEIMEILRSKEKITSGRDKELNDMVNSLDHDHSPEEKELKREKLPKYEEGKPGVDYDFYDDGTFTIKNRKTAHSSFEEPSVAYDNLGRFYGIDLEKVIYGKGGYEEVRDKTNFSGDIIYSESEWDKFEDWLKKTHGVDLEQIRKEKFEEYKKSHEPIKRFDWWK